MIKKWGFGDALIRVFESPIKQLKITKNSRVNLLIMRNDFLIDDMEMPPKVGILTSEIRSVGPPTSAGGV